ncbi:MAG: alpha/beta hydrolase [Eubacteriales bacterium]
MAVIFKKICSYFLAFITMISTFFGTIFPQIKALTNLSFGTSEAQKVDLYLPKTNKSKCTAVVVFIHGGAWSAGDKGDYKSACERQVKNGYAAASINYRMLGEGATWKEMLEDITSAMQLVKTTAAENGIVLKKAGLTGGSAGAHLAMLYSYKNQSISPIAIVFCGDQCGPSNFLDINVAEGSADPAWTYDILSGLIGQKLDKTTFAGLTEQLRAASPVTYITKDSPPTIVAHGLKDDIVLYSQGTDVYNTFLAAGAVCELIPYPNSGHGLDSDPDCSKRYDSLFKEYELKYFGY